MDRYSLILNVCYSWVWYSCDFMAAVCALSSLKHGRQSLDFAELPVTKFQEDNKELHTTSWRADFAKENPFSCFLKGIQAKNTLVLATAPLLPSQLPTKMGMWWGKVLHYSPIHCPTGLPLLPLRSCTSFLFHPFPSFSLTIHLPFSTQSLLYSTHYICILIIFHNTDEENLSSCFEIVKAIV